MDLRQADALPDNSPPSWALDWYPRPWDLSEPLGPICAAMAAAGLLEKSWRAAALAAIEYDGIADLMRMWPDAEDDAERTAIVLDIEELLDDMKVTPWTGPRNTVR